MRSRRPQDMPGDLGKLVRAQLAREAERELRAELKIDKHDHRLLPRQPGQPGPKLTRLERRYRDYLQAEQAAGRVLTFRWEPFRLVLRHGGAGQKGMTYAPDALVVPARLSRREEPCCIDCDGGWCSLCLDHHGKRPCPVEEDYMAAVELHEVKPAKPDGSPLWLGDSRTKLLAAVEILRGVPWTFVLVTPDGAGWRRQCL